MDRADHFTPETDQNQCVCKDSNVLIFDRKQTSWLASGVLVVSFFVFITGYFMGKRASVQEFMQKITTATDVDIDSSSIYMDNKKNMVTNSEITTSIDSPTTNIDTEAVVGQSEIKTIENESKIEEPVIMHEYAAELIGFGTEKAAQAFANKLTEKDIPVIVRKRSGKTAQGKVVSWYQVVTEKYTDKLQLQKVVDRLEKEERLAGVRLITI